MPLSGLCHLTSPRRLTTLRPALVWCTHAQGDTTGFYDQSDGLHPFGYAHITQIAPKMAGLVWPLLPKAACTSA